MKKNRKQILYCVLVFLVSLSMVVFAGCGKIENGENNVGGDGILNGDQVDDFPIQTPGGSENDSENSGDSENTGDSENNGTDDNLKPSEPQKVYDYYIRATTQGLSVRSGAGTSFSKVGTMDNDDLLAYKGVTNGWYKTVYKQKVAYVSSSYSQVVQIEKSNNAKIENIIEKGKELMGYPYVWGSQRYHWGNGVLNSNFVQGEFDCSALMQYIFSVGAKINLDTTSRTQSLQGAKVSKANLKRGDLMFFTNSSRLHLTGVERIGHVALYLGDNRILHTASDFAVIEQISNTRWGYFESAKRFLW